MPTIDQLEPAIVASDDDVIPISQGGAARRVTRSQLLAGTQGSLVLNSGLLGRVSAGLGPPQQISIGGGLSLADGVLSGRPQFAVASLSPSSSVTTGDLVAVSQNGQDHAVSVRALLSTSGIDVSDQLARGPVGTVRRVGEWIGDAVAAEAFGAVGDGVTNDAPALSRAIASGRPVLLGPKTYCVDGQWNIQTDAVLIGTAGLSTLRRTKQSGGAWINVTGPSFTSTDIVFDAGSLVGDSWAVLLSPDCTRSVFAHCGFINSTGATLGCGLTVQARDGVIGRPSSHRISHCVFRSNTCHGLWVQAAAGAIIENCTAERNGRFGICLDYNDASFKQIARQTRISDCCCYANERGISVGNYNASNLEPPTWGLDHPDAVDIVISTNIVSGNSAYGIAVSGSRIQVVQNQIIIDGGALGASGILCNSMLSVIAGNSICGPGQYGIDSGGSSDLAIAGNLVQSFAVGINAGGSVRVHISDNNLVGNARAITLFHIETDGRGANFGISAADLWVEDNLIQVGPGSGGVFLFDGPERVVIARNKFIAPVSDSFPNLCWAHTDTAVVHDNTLNGSPTLVIGPQANGTILRLSVPDILDVVTTAPSATRIDAIVGLHEGEMIGQVSFIRVIDGGVGYASATVTISGSGAGAIARPHLRNGAVIGIAVTSGGSGYDPLSTTASIVGDGQGCSLKPFVGLPIGPDRRLTLRNLSQIVFPVSASNTLTNWTQAAITMPAGAETVWQGTPTGWQAVQFSNIDYVRPGGDGSLSIQSGVGDVRLRPGAGGNVRVCSEIEPGGFITCCGRGSPEGVVSATPGSDYRNLNGGAGMTLWIKRSGIGNSGWSAVA